MTPHFSHKGKDFQIKLVWFPKIEGKILACPPYQRDFFQPRFKMPSPILGISIFRYFISAFRDDYSHINLITTRIGEVCEVEAHEELTFSIICGGAQVI